MTNVVLLANPAHQTALNTRKRLVQKGHLSCDQELRFCGFILRASRDGSKQSIIWDHRRWLLNRRFLHPSVDISALSLAVSGNLQEAKPFPMIPHDSIEVEFELIRSACTTYPRNYHAWTHWRYLMDAIYLTMAGSEEGYIHFVHIAKEEFDSLLQWIESHASDTSAIHHLCSIQKRFHQLPSPITTQGPLLKDLLSPTAIANHAVSLVERYPSHESLWIYTRSSLIDAPVADRSDIFHKTETNAYASRSLCWLSERVSCDMKCFPIMSS
ncbi:protein prenylyltransferase [Pluteus cervinus]|uniref:Protein prenylyltransferase n=1 Tax=Pluteus cervinus TaxID=181527 RepID=A0ACD3B860_9AGAR|nr:protein prenylyltransferase [Pluteus cervinus]